MKRIAIAAVLLVTLVGPVWAGMDEGFAAIERGDLNEWRPLAEQGHADAQYNLGVMYNNGQGVTQDYAEAMRWFRKAAEQGWAEAQYNLGVMYNNGQGVTQDYVQAAKWYRKAAEQGLADAQHSHITSTLRPAYRSSRRLDWTRLR